MSDTAPPPAGWYADPENPAGERWWNGSGWSDQKRDSTLTTTPAVPAPDPEASGFAFGAPAAPAAPRPDPYAPPAPAQPYYAAQPDAPAYQAQPYYAAASPYAPAPYGAPARGSGVNGLALAGLIVSAVGWLVIPLIAGIAGIILSAFGLNQARQREAAGNPNHGRGLATAGLVVGIVVTAFSVIAVVGYIALMASYMGTY